MGALRAQQVGICLVDDDLGLSPGELPECVRPTDVVDVAVRAQDPSDVFDPPPERL